MKKLIGIILLSAMCLGETDPFFAEKGYTLKNDAWVFSPDKAKDIRDRLIDLDTEKKLNLSLNNTILLHEKNDKISQDKINLLLEQNDKLAKSAHDAYSMSQWERIGFFALGIAATVFAGFAIKKAGE